MTVMEDVNLDPSLLALRQGMYVSQVRNELERWGMHPRRAKELVEYFFAWIKDNYLWGTHYETCAEYLFWNLSGLVRY